MGGVAQTPGGLDEPFLGGTTFDGYPKDLKIAPATAEDRVRIAMLKTILAKCV